MLLLVQVSTADVDTYKGIRAAIKRCISELEGWRLQKDWGAAEWAVVYVRPTGADVQVCGQQQGRSRVGGGVCSAYRRGCAGVWVSAGSGQRGVVGAESGAGGRDRA